MEFKEGMKVEHTNHGKGIIIEVDKFDLDSVTVEFDIEPSGWGNSLRVSKNCLKIID